jgi:hypothetical protein
MGVGLVGAGIGSDVSGGLFDIFSGGGGDEDAATKSVKKKIEAAEKKLVANPKDTVALAELTRYHYSLAATDTSEEDGTFGKKGKEELAKASAAWKRYLAAKPEKPDIDLANTMTTAYSQIGLNQPENGVEAAEVVAEEQNDARAYLTLFQYATLANQTRKAELAADKALELAKTKDERAQVKQAIEQVKAQGSGATGAGGPAPGG